MENENRFNDVWEAIADSQEQAAEWRRDAEMMDSIIDTIKANQWSKKKAAQQCGISVEKINHLLKNRLSQFSTNDLITILENLKKNSIPTEQPKFAFGISAKLQPA